MILVGTEPVRIEEAHRNRLGIRTDVSAGGADLQSDLQSDLQIAKCEIKSDGYQQRRTYKRAW